MQILMLISKITIGLIIMPNILIMGAKGGENIDKDDFAIYLPQNKIYYRSYTREKILNIKLDKIKLSSNPIISRNEIIAYQKDTHTIELSAETINRINMLRLKYGTVAFVCVGKKPIYWGVFLNDICEVGYDAIAIMLPSPLDSNKNTIQIKCGYPSEEWFTGKDLRNSKEIMESLRKAGKLKEK